MLNTEHVAVYLIFTLILIIALFNIIGSIIMMILDKKKNLKTLYNLGATVKELRAIFFYQGILMTVIGGSLGLVIGVITVWLQQQFSLLMITPSLVLSCGSSVDQCWDCTGYYFGIGSCGFSHRFSADCKNTTQRLNKLVIAKNRRDFIKGGKDIGTVVASHHFCSKGFKIGNAFKVVGIMTSGF